jgi:hypothetical protein
MRDIKAFGQRAQNIQAVRVGVARCVAHMPQNATKSSAIFVPITSKRIHEDTHSRGHLAPLAVQRNAANLYLIRCCSNRCTHARAPIQHHARAHTRTLIPPLPLREKPPSLNCRIDTHVCVSVCSRGGAGTRRGQHALGRAKWMQRALRCNGPALLPKIVGSGEWGTQKVASREGKKAGRDKALV